MSQEAFKLGESKQVVESSHKSSLERVKETHTQELIISLCGFIGSNIEAVAKTIKKILEEQFDYDCEIIKLSDLILKNSHKYLEEVNKSLPQNKSDSYNDIKRKIECGNRIREDYNPSVLAEIAMKKIGLARQEHEDKKDEKDRLDRGSNKKERFTSQRKCFIIDSLKNPNELKLIREVYRNLSYTIGVFSPEHIREDNLESRGMQRLEYIELIDQDSGEDLNHGQNVRDTFKQSDFFLRIDSNNDSEIERKIQRYLHLIFGTKIVTPTNEESFMFIAASAASNSGCLSRQVGAALVDETGELISVGWNDVPKYGGNLYIESQPNNITLNDNRCFCWNTDRRCYNDKYKHEIVKDLIKQLIDQKLVENSKKDELEILLKKSKVSNLIEYSRSIHAEMHAIIIGSQKAGEKVRGSTLFCTTFPCHNCARHIVTAGIRYVYYIEPYLKSEGTNLHRDSITEDEKEQDKVLIKIYDGVSPNRFIQFFKMNDDKRKDNEGKIYLPQQKNASPKYTESLESLTTLESYATKLLDKDLKI